MLSLAASWAALSLYHSAAASAPSEADSSCFAKVAVRHPKDALLGTSRHPQGRLAAAGSEEVQECEENNDTQPLTGGEKVAKGEDALQDA